MDASLAYACRVHDKVNVPSPVHRIIVAGRVVRAECETPLAGARVELATVKLNNLERISRSDRDGRFQFAFLGQDAKAVAEHLREFSVRVTTFDGAVLASCPAPRIPDATVQVGLDDAQIEEAGLTPAVSRPVLQPDFFPMLRAAARTLPSAEFAGAEAILDRLTCQFPPLLIDPGILDIARGVLFGRLEDWTELRARLDQVDIWGKAHGLETPARDLQESQRLLAGLRAAPPHQHASNRHDRGLSTTDDRTLVMIAAARISGGEPIAFVRNVELVHQQFAVAERFADFSTFAADALGGDGSRFLQRLQAFGGCGPGLGPLPFPPEFPGGFPWPRPEPFPWPDFGVPPIRECDAEAARALAEALERRVDYTIEEIEPPNACPGHTITIRGTDLLFEGTTGGVWFNSARRGMPIWAPATPTPDGNLETVVPSGARCGPIELNASSRATMIVCGATHELHVGPDEEFEFLGGETAIASFRSTQAECPHAGDTVVFLWELCNSTSHTLTFVIREGGRVRTQRPPRASEQDRYVHVLPRVGGHYDFEAILEVNGPCGEDVQTIRFAVQHPYGRAGDPYGPDRFDNWFGNIGRPVRSVAPTTLRELVDAVLAAESESMRVGTRGSGWSYTDCVVPLGTNRMIDTSELNGLVRNVLPGALRDSISSVFPAALRTILTTALGTTALPIESRLVHVEAGIKVHELNRVLDRLDRSVPPGIPLALPTLGGSNGQSIAGAISTGTHGANPGMPPIADFVRAIHLVGPGGQQWWLEPESRPITDAARMADLKARGVIDPCMRVEYSDSLFFACLVSMGCAGIIYSVVVEAVEAHRLTSTTTPPMPWSVARPLVAASVVTPATPAPWFSETILNASKLAWTTTRTPTGLAPDGDPCAEPDNTLLDTLLVFLVGSGIAAGPGLIGVGAGALGAVLGALPDYIARRTAELSFQPWRWGEITDEIEFVERVGVLLDGLANLIATEGDEQVLAETMPKIFNVLWQMGLYFLDGRTIVEQAQNLFTTLGQRPPGTTIRKSYTAMTGQCDVTLDTYRPPAEHGPLERQIESWEFGLPAVRTLPFVDDLLAAADRIRGTNDALILNLAVRFTAGTSALLGMQQFPRTGHVEVFTVKGMAGNPAMHPEIDRIARDYGAVPHWGQFHEVLTDYSSHFPGLPSWRVAMDFIARESARATGSSPNTFRQRFAIRRGLLSDL